MRRPAGIAGATLVYAPGDRFPDLILALQFLLDDFRRDGRHVNGVRLAGPTLRLRVEDFELAASVAPGPLPVAAFHDVLRPAQAGPAGAPLRHDLARGRLLHAIRHHRWALGVLLRARGGADAGSANEEFDLGAECRTVVAALVEACPPQFILWQASGVLFTLAEFRNANSPRLNAPGDPRTAINPRLPPAAPIPRPAFPDWAPPDEGAATGEKALAPTIASADAGLATIALSQYQGRSRLGRLRQRSAGRLFRRTTVRQHQSEQPALDRTHRRLGRAFGRDVPAAGARSPQRRPRRRIRLLGCALLTLVAIFLPPLGGA